MGCLSCKNCEFIRTSAFCGNTKLTQKQLYSKAGYCSHYEPKDTNNPEKSVTMDREKVIKALEYCRNQAGCWSDESECPWIAECREDVNSLKDATLALLKEQEPLEPDTDCDGSEDEHSSRSWWYVCKACGGQIDYKDDYCRHCGRPQNWSNIKGE